MATWEELEAKRWKPGAAVATAPAPGPTPAATPRPAGPRPKPGTIKDPFEDIMGEPSAWDVAKGMAMEAIPGEVGAALPLVLAAEANPLGLIGSSLALGLGLRRAGGEVRRKYFPALERAVQERPALALAMDLGMNVPSIAISGYRTLGELGEAGLAGPQALRAAVKGVGARAGVAGVLGGLTSAGLQIGAGALRGEGPGTSFDAKTMLRDILAIMASTEFPTDKYRGERIRFYGILAHLRNAGEMSAQEEAALQKQFAEATRKGMAAKLKQARQEGQNQALGVKPPPPPAPGTTGPAAGPGPTVSPPSGERPAGPAAGPTTTPATPGAPPPVTPPAGALDENGLLRGLRAQLASLATFYGPATSLRDRLAKLAGTPPLFVKLVDDAGIPRESLPEPYRAAYDKGAGAAPAGAPAAGKEAAAPSPGPAVPVNAWDQTPDEWTAANPGTTPAEHEAQVRRAISEGRLIPEKVQRMYPGIFTKFAPPPEPLGVTQPRATESTTPAGTTPPPPTSQPASSLATKALIEKATLVESRWAAKVGGYQVTAKGLDRTTFTRINEGRAVKTATRARRILDDLNAGKTLSDDDTAWIRDQHRIAQQEQRRTGKAYPPVERPAPPAEGAPEGISGAKEGGVSPEGVLPGVEGPESKLGGTKAASTPREGTEPYGIAQTKPGANPEALPLPEGALIGKEGVIYTEGAAKATSRYVVVSSKRVVPSHDYSNPNLEEGSITSKVISNAERGTYPRNLQPRDIEGNPEALARPFEYAKKIEPERLISTAPEVGAGPPTVGVWDKNPGSLVVFNGSARAGLIHRIYAMGGEYATAYRNTLIREAEQFGISPEAVAAIKDPMLVRVVDLHPESPFAHKFADLGNAPAGMGEAPLREAARLHYIITPEILNEIPVTETSTFSDAVNEASARGFRTLFRDRLREEGASNVIPHLFVAGTDNLTDTGKSYIQNMLMSKIFPVDVLERLGDSRKGMKRMLEGIVPQLMLADKRLGEDSFVPQLKIAVDFLSQHPTIRDSKDLNDILRQKNLWGESSVEADAAVRVMAHFLLDAGGAKDARLKVARIFAYLDQERGGLVPTGDPKSKLIVEALGKEYDPNVIFGKAVEEKAKAATKVNEVGDVEALGGAQQMEGTPPPTPEPRWADMPEHVEVNGKTYHRDGYRTRAVEQFNALKAKIWDRQGAIRRTVAAEVNGRGKRKVSPKDVEILVDPAGMRGPDGAVSVRINLPEDGPQFDSVNMLNIRAALEKSGLKGTPLAKLEILFDFNVGQPVGEYRPGPTKWIGPEGSGQKGGWVGYPEGTPLDSPPKESEMMLEGEYWNRLKSDYFDLETRTPIASSKQKSATPMGLRVGMWRIEDRASPRGREISQLRLLDPNDLVLTEGMVEKNIEGRGEDAARYAAWQKEGKAPPPIEVVESFTPSTAAQLVVVNGHRRVAAAKRNGTPILAWVSPSMDYVPAKGEKVLRYDGDPKKPIIKVALTYEAWKAGKAKRTGPLVGGFSDLGVAAPEGFPQFMEGTSPVRGQIHESRKANIARKDPSRVVGVPDLSEAEQIVVKYALNGAEFSRISPAHDRFNKYLALLVENGAMTKGDVQVLRAIFAQAELATIGEDRLTIFEEDLDRPDPKTGQTKTISGEFTPEAGTDKGMIAIHQELAKRYRYLFRLRGGKASPESPAATLLHEFYHSQLELKGNADDRKLVKAWYDSFTPEEREAYARETLKTDGGAPDERYVQYVTGKASEFFAHAGMDYALTRRVPGKPLKGIADLFDRMLSLFVGWVQRLQGVEVGQARERIITPEIDALMTRMFEPRKGWEDVRFDVEGGSKAKLAGENRMAEGVVGPRRVSESGGFEGPQQMAGTPMKPGSGKTVGEAMDLIYQQQREKYGLRPWFKNTFRVLNEMLNRVHGPSDQTLAAINADGKRAVELRQLKGSQAAAAMELDGINKAVWGDPRYYLMTDAQRAAAGPDTPSGITGERGFVNRPVTRAERQLLDTYFLALNTLESYGRVMPKRTKAAQDAETRYLAEQMKYSREKARGRSKTPEGAAIMALRANRLRQAKAAWEKAAKEVGFASPYSQDQARAVVDYVEAHPTIGPDFKARARMLNEGRTRVLDQMQADGLLTPESREALEVDFWIPRRFLQHINEIERGVGEGSVGTSGIKELKQGSMRGLETDSQKLMNEWVGGIYNLIFRNRAQQPLITMAEDGVAPDMIRFAKPGEKQAPGGYTMLYAMKDGERVTLVGHDSWAKQWVKTDPKLDSGIATFFRWISGSAVLKPMATALNLGFSAAQVPSDFAYVWALTDVYSQKGWKTPFQFLGALQAAGDYASILGDLRTHGPLYQEMVRRGAIQNYFGTEQMNTLRHIPGIGPVGDQIAQIANYTENMTRMIVFKRARENMLKAGMSAEEAGHKAAWEARSYLDYSEKGWGSGALDTAMPFFAVTIRAGAKAADKLKTAGMKLPKGEVDALWWKIANFGALVTGLYFANKWVNPETEADVPDYVKRDYLVLTLPFSRIDAGGNRRGLYVTVKLDQALRPWKNLFDAMAHKAATGEAPPYAVSKFLKVAWESQLFGVSDIMPPTMKAALTYTMNMDIFRGEPVWQGAKVIPEAEIDPYGRTNPLAVDIGQSLGASPARLDAAVESILTHDVWGTLVGGSYKALKRQVDSDTAKAMDDHAWNTFRNAPGASRYIRQTNPSRQTELFDSIDKLERHYNTIRLKMKAAVRGENGILRVVTIGQEWNHGALPYVLDLAKREKAGKGFVDRWLFSKDDIKRLIAEEMAPKTARQRALGLPGTPQPLLPTGTTGALRP